MYVSKIKITLRSSILDPQGKAIEHAIGTMNLGTIKDVRMGKYIEVKIDSVDEDGARFATEEICRKLLANPVMEDFQYELQKI